jgi:hypothetical protein
MIDLTFAQALTPDFHLCGKVVKRFDPGFADKPMEE